MSTFTLIAIAAAMWAFQPLQWLIFVLAALYHGSRGLRLITSREAPREGLRRLGGLALLALTATALSLPTVAVIIPLLLIGTVAVGARLLRNPAPREEKFRWQPRPPETRAARPQAPAPPRRRPSDWAQFLEPREGRPSVATPGALPVARATDAPSPAIEPPPAPPTLEVERPEAGADQEEPDPFDRFLWLR